MCVPVSRMSKDAILIVPQPVAEASAYGHLAAFVRLAPVPQRQSLWSAVGETLGRRVGEKPVWLSTAGTGVSWLHVRLDDRPKYYGYPLTLHVAHRPVTVSTERSRETFAKKYSHDNRN